MHQLIPEITFIPPQIITREVKRDTQIPIVIIENPNYISTSLREGKGAVETQIFSFLLNKVHTLRKICKITLMNR